MAAMETKRTHRAGRCGYAIDPLRACRRRTKTLVLIAHTVLLNNKVHTARIVEWQYRCMQHKAKP